MSVESMSHICEEHQCPSYACAGRTHKKIETMSPASEQPVDVITQLVDEANYTPGMLEILPPDFIIPFKGIPKTKIEVETENQDAVLGPTPAFLWRNETNETEEIDKNQQILTELEEWINSERYIPDYVIHPKTPETKPSFLPPYVKERKGYGLNEASEETKKVILKLKEQLQTNIKDEKKEGVTETISIEKEGKKMQREFFGELFTTGKIIYGYRDTEEMENLKLDDITKKEKNKIVKKYVLLFEDTEGKTMEYDILERFNTANATILLDEKLDIPGHYSFEKNIVTINKLDNFEVLSRTLIHELRHSYQSTQTKFQNIKENYIISNHPDYDNMEKWKEVINREGLEGIIHRLQTVFNLSTEETYTLLEPFISNNFNINDPLREHFREKQLEKTQNMKARSALRNMIDPAAWTQLIKTFQEKTPVEKLKAEKIYIEFDPTSIRDEFGSRKKRLFEALENTVLTEANEELVSGKNETQYMFDWQNASIENGTYIVLTNKKLLGTKIKIPLQINQVEEVDNIIKNIHIEYKNKKTTLEETRARERKNTQTKLTARTEILPGVTILDVYRLPTSILERDAEFGALLGMRTIQKETGIRLLDKVPNDYTQRIIEAFNTKEDEHTPLIEKLRHRILALTSIKEYQQMIGVPPTHRRSLEKATIDLKKKRI